MKKIFTLFAVVMFVGFYSGQAQDPDGSFAKDFNLYEINKTSGNMETDHVINLYSLLNDYKTVYIDVSASTCGPCYNFHNTGTLKNLWTNYGPSSTVNDSYVLFIEDAETGSTWTSLTGGGYGNQGTWNVVSGVEYPVIPLFISPNYVYGSAACNANTFNIDYDDIIEGYPSVFMVCPNRMMFDLYGNVASNANTYHNQIASKCPTWTNANDALLGLQKLSDHLCFCTNSIVPKVLLQNVGTSPLTSVTMRVTCDSEVQTFTWQGNLAQFESEIVELSPITPPREGNLSLVVEIVEANGEADGGNKYNSHTETVNVQRTSDRATIAQNFSTSSLSPWTLVDNTGGNCGRANGALRFKAYSIKSGTAEFYAPLLNFSTNANPALLFDVAYSRYYSNGAPIYSDSMRVMVSDDCGATWDIVYDKQGADLETYVQSSGEFTSPTNRYRHEVIDLTEYTGAENVIIKFVFMSGYGNNIFIDNIDICDSPLAVEEHGNSELSVFPNPVKDVVTINFDKAVSQIEVYDVYGKLVKTFTTVNNSVNVSDLASGVYMLNMQTEDGVIVRKIVKE
ncbi:MAG: T9SS type A sorting domain-containing protein [Bacteroidales bacterium]|nr:T9SS type A sorting domain-containing protein [Bacteroidales bacterium]